MKVVAVVGGGRKGGNCDAVANKLVAHLARFGISDLEANIMELAQYKVLPCRECSYECFHARCPVDDEAHKLIHAMYSADVTLLIVPTYGGLPPASFVALLQRRQNEMTKLCPPKQFVVGVVLANESGDYDEFTPAIVRSTVEQWGADRTSFVQLKPRDYQKTSIQLGLADNPAVELELDNVVTKIQDWFQSSILGVYKSVI